MAWIELHQTMPRHRKTIRLATMLKISRREAVGLLVDLWTWALDNAEKNGEINMKSSEISAAIDWPARKSDLLISALVESGYIDEGKNQIIIHDWYEYAGKLSDKRADDRARKAKDKFNRSNRIPMEVQRNDNGIPYVTVPNPVTIVTEPNRTQPNQGTNVVNRTVGEPPTHTQRQRFTPPSVDMVREYCQERGKGVDASMFIDFYTSKGWYVGKNPMRDWKAAVRTWEKRSGEQRSGNVFAEMLAKEGLNDE